nr:immunoglobulin light chain junction region [Macaca mulatta]MOW37045.1 immunoglobulin light chain junction region [Macaca mulatta]MOW38900.1 immunoglobulin light chain junction region [Macaca mulatta]
DYYCGSWHDSGNRPLF